MNEVWYAAFGLLVLLTVVNSVVLVAVLRQVGVLHQRVRPLGAGQYEGPEVGSRLPRVAVDPVSGSMPVEPFTTPITIVGYVSPSCGLCDELAEIATAYRKHRPADMAEILLATEADMETAGAWLRDHEPRVPFVRYGGLMKLHQVPGSPYVLAFTGAGPHELKVLAAGVVNTLEQLEELAALAMVNFEGGVAAAGEPPEAPLHEDPDRLLPIAHQGGHDAR